MPTRARPSPSRPRRPVSAGPDRRAGPLYDPAFEHDACGVGFVADAGGHARGRVLPLALAGLAALGHRGAFAADGESSDGAGISISLDPAVARRIAPGLGRRPGVVMLFLPADRRGSARARRIVSTALRAEGLAEPVWREVPVDPAALGAQAAASRPTVAQALVARPSGLPARAFELALIVARRRMEAAARAAGLDGFAVPSASSRTVVYKGLVAGGRLARLYPDLAAPLPIRYAIFHQRYATNTHPVWGLAQPFRHLAHNGEINTVRGNRAEVTGRIADALPSAAARRLAAVPLLSPDGSDSLSLDEAIELLVATGWPIGQALLAIVPEAQGLRRRPHALAAAFAGRAAGFLAPWDGPAALVFGDGRQVGALVDRNGLRPLAFAITAERLVAAASEAGAVPLTAAETVRRGRLGPGELLLVGPAAGVVLEDEDAKTELLRGTWLELDPPRVHHDAVPTRVAAPGAATSLPRRALAGLDAERARLDIRTMALEGHEPLWSMGDDTPLPGLGRADRPFVDHLRQAFAQVTNPAIDPERERAVMDLAVLVGPRPPLLGGPPRRAARGVRLERPLVADLERLVDSATLAGLRVRRLDASWSPAAGPAGLGAALDRLAAEALGAVGRADVLVLSDRAFGLDRPPIPSALAVGAVHAALARVGRRGRLDLVVESADVLDVHALAMALAAGARAVVPWLAVELAAELAGGRGAEELTAGECVANLLGALETGLRKVLARMGISSAGAYVGGALFESLELAPEVVERCFPAAASWPGTVGLVDLAERQLHRLEAARRLAAAPPPGGRLADAGLARYRGDGELHLFAPPIVGEIQALAGAGEDGSEAAIARYRAALARPAAVVRDGLAIRRRESIPLAEVEPVASIAPRFVTSAMSVGALSPEAHQAVTIGIQRLGGSANTGEGGEDPEWYLPGPDGRRRDARIKQIASARFGVTSQYLARAGQLEIKIAQGSKPGEGGQLPGRKATAYIAALRRAQPGQALISPPPHHDIYSIEDLAELIADLRAINPRARVGVKLVATRGIGTIAAGVAKAGADYIHVAGHSGGTGASPLSSIKHVGAPWELGLSEVHQTLLRNGLRDRVALRTDGGLQTGRDLLVATLLGAEEFGFGTAALVAIGCDMARQCHLDTCPTGIATQRGDLRAKFTGTPDQVVRFFTALAEDLRRELAAIGARSVGEVVGEAGRYLRPAGGRRTLELAALLGARRWGTAGERRARPTSAGSTVERAPASTLERGLLAGLQRGGARIVDGLAITTADRAFGAELSGALERGEVDAQGGRIRLGLCGSAGQSLGAFLAASVALTLEGQANDYVGKGLAGGTIVLRPEPDLAAAAAGQAIAGNTCLYGATAGRLHVVGRAGMRFAVRNSGAEAVVEGVGPHGCEYMTGGVVVVLGPVGANFGAGMTGGRAYLLDPSGRHASHLHAPSVSAVRMSGAVRERADGAALVAELRRLLEDHRDAGSALAGRLLEGAVLPLGDLWLVEPVGGGDAAATLPSERPAAAAAPGGAG